LFGDLQAASPVGGVPEDLDIEHTIGGRVASQPAADAPLYLQRLG